MPVRLSIFTKPVLVTAVITTCDRPHLVRRAIQSVLAQTYQPLEVIVVEDGSNSGIKEWLEKKNLRQFRYVRHEKNEGLAKVRNIGLKLANGDYIAFLDDDDEWKPDCIEKRIVALQKLSPKERESLGVVYCGCEIHIPHENRITHNMPKIEGNIKKYIINNDLSTIPSSCLFPKKVLQAIGGFDESLSSSIDHDIWMKLAVHEYHAFAVKEPLVITYHTRERKSMVSETTSRIRGVEEYLEKWAQTYQEWYGQEGGKRYIRYYRAKVLGGLAGKKLAEGKFQEASRLICFVTSRNRWSISSSAFLTWLIGRSVVRMFVPGKLIGLFKKRKMVSHKQDVFRI